MWENVLKELFWRHGDTELATDAASVVGGAWVPGQGKARIER